jgi:D-methionine transport system ATP-binding protein
LTPTLGRVARETGIDFNILAGRIDRIKHMPYGQLTLALQGAGVDAALIALRDAGIEIEELN